MILIGLGSNLPSHAGTPDVTLRVALAELELNGVELIRVSRFYSTPAWPDPSDPTYVNAVACVATSLDPSALMARLHCIEESFGRKRGLRNAPRTLDLDLIDYDGRIEGGPPVLPHPRIETRAFVLVPLAEIASEWRHPVSGRKLSELIDALETREREGVQPL